MNRSLSRRAAALARRIGEPEPEVVFDAERMTPDELIALGTIAAVQDRLTGFPCMAALAAEMTDDELRDVLHALTDLDGFAVRTGQRQMTDDLRHRQRLAEHNRREKEAGRGKWSQ